MLSPTTAAPTPASPSTSAAPASPTKTPWGGGGVSGIGSAWTFASAVPTAALRAARRRCTAPSFLPRACLLLAPALALLVLTGLLLQSAGVPPPDYPGYLHNQLLNNGDGKELAEGCVAFERHFVGPPAPPRNEAALGVGGEAGAPSFTPAVEAPTAATVTEVPQRVLFVHYNDRLETRRYLCAVESAARWNPEVDVVVVAVNASGFAHEAAAMLQAAGLGPGRVVDGGIAGLAAHFAAADKAEANRKKGGWLGRWLTGWFKGPPRGSVLFTELRWEEAFSGTPLEAWYTSGAYLNSSWVTQNLGNAFRMGLVYTLGGVYMDLDIVSMNSIPQARVGRMLTMQDPKSFNNAYLGFPPGDEFVWALMEEFVRGFNGYYWGHNGPKMVTRTFNALCKRPNGEAPAATCTSLTVAAPHVLHPASYEERKVLFEDWRAACDFMGSIVERSIGMHWWHKRLEDGVTLARESVLGRVMQRTCPATLATSGAAALELTDDVEFSTPAEVMGPIAKHKKS
ncbi:Alpha-1,4-N-acetylglucosaminyltransferase [Cladochytrium tenue]|nr:Alpha-1,4-N-acetylglucosaminyltransferase [Cladochytrium tenue]